MLNWLKQFFVKERKEKIPKCYKCGLVASTMVFMEFKTMELEEIEDNILVQLCSHCHTELFVLYDKDYIPPIINKNRDDNNG